MAAWFAVFALVLQTLIVAPAHAGGAIEICTPQGLQTLYVDQHIDNDKPVKTNNGHCGLCVLMAPADAQAPRLSQPVRYAHHAELAPLANVAPPASARGPPRPFGQAPPAPLTA